MSSKNARKDTFGSGLKPSEKGQQSGRKMKKPLSSMSKRMSGGTEAARLEQARFRQPFKQSSHGTMSEGEHGVAEDLSDNRTQNQNEKLRAALARNGALKQRLQQQEEENLNLLEKIDNMKELFHQKVDQIEEMVV